MNISIRLLITNTSSEEVHYLDKNRLCDYLLDIRRDDGTQIPELDEVQHQECDDTGRANTRIIQVDLKPQESRRDIVFLRDFADVTRPGVYTVRVGRVLPPTITKEVTWSNPVVITVKP